MPVNATTSTNAPILGDYVRQLKLPSDFCLRSDPLNTDQCDQVLQSMSTKENSRRRFLLGVYMAFICLAEELCKQQGVTSIKDVLDAFPPVESAGARRANTLTLGEPKLSLRTHYNDVEKLIRHDLSRPDYPNCAPHATQSWAQYKEQFSDICLMSPDERKYLMGLLWEKVLEIPMPETDDDAVREIRPFEHIILNFPTAPREPPGVVLQAFAYAYFRADSPNVTFRPFKVGAGSSSVQTAGDVDGWVGDKLAMSVEVKDKDIDDSNLNEFDQFILQLKHWPNCTALALANGFSDTAVDYLASHNILAFDRQSMATNVSYWDVPKQKIAVRELHFYFARVQGSSRLTNRFHKFCSEEGIDLDSQ